MSELTAADAGLVFVDPTAYADEARFHAACTVLPRDDPIHRVEHPDFAPFWAITPTPPSTAGCSNRWNDLVGHGRRRAGPHREPRPTRRLQADPSLVTTAAGEIIRWVTPVKHFMQNARPHGDPRMEIKALLTELLPRLRSIELAGEPRLM